MILFFTSVICLVKKQIISKTFWCYKMLYIETYYLLTYIMESFKQLISSSTPVLVDFYADWCSPCKTMSTILVKVKEIQSDRIRIIKINVDKNRATALHYSIQSVPTLMIFKDGKQLWRQSGVVGADELNRIIDMFK